MRMDSPMNRESDYSIVSVSTREVRSIMEVYQNSGCEDRHGRCLDGEIIFEIRSSQKTGLADLIDYIFETRLKTRAVWFACVAKRGVT
jgi:hypothetical protein